MRSAAEARGTSWTRCTRRHSRPAGTRRGTCFDLADRTRRPLPVLTRARVVSGPCWWTEAAARSSSCSSSSSAGRGVVLADVAGGAAVCAPPVEEPAGGCEGVGVPRVSTAPDPALEPGEAEPQRCADWTSPDCPCLGTALGEFAIGEVEYKVARLIDLGGVTRGQALAMLVEDVVQRAAEVQADKAARELIASSDS